MAEYYVHEISRRALQGLADSGRLDLSGCDAGWLVGHNIVVMCCCRGYNYPDGGAFSYEGGARDFKLVLANCEGWSRRELLDATLEYRRAYRGNKIAEVWHVVDDADDDSWEDALDELLLSGSGSDWRARCGAVDKLENEAETLESLRQLREAGALDDVEPLHDDLTAYVYEGGKPENWHLLIKFDGDDNEYRLSNADDARDFITTIESIYQLEETSLTV